MKHAIALAVTIISLFTARPVQAQVYDEAIYKKCWDERITNNPNVNWDTAPEGFKQEAFKNERAYCKVEALKPWSKQAYEKCYDTPDFAKQRDCQNALNRENYGELKKLGVIYEPSSQKHSAFAIQTTVIQRAIEAYVMGKKSLPNSLNVLTSCDNNALTCAWKLSNEALVDPWGKGIRYTIIDGPLFNYWLTTYGADAKEGGSGEASDFTVSHVANSALSN
jgi:hypothetical protein